MTLAASDYDSAVAYNGSASATRPRLGTETLEEWYEAWEDVVYPVVERMQDDTDSDESLASAVARVVAGLAILWQHASSSTEAAHLLLPSSSTMMVAS